MLLLLPIFVVVLMGLNAGSFLTFPPQGSQPLRLRVDFHKPTVNPSVAGTVTVGANKFVASTSVSVKCPMYAWFVAHAEARSGAVGARASTTFGGRSSMLSAGRRRFVRKCINAALTVTRYTSASRASSRRRAARLGHHRDRLSASLAAFCSASITSPKGSTPCIRELVFHAKYTRAASAADVGKHTRTPASRYLRLHGAIDRVVAPTERLARTGLDVLRRGRRPGQ